MEQCLDFAATSSTSFLAYLQQKRGGGHHRLHLCTAYPGPREISFKTNENEWIIVEIFLPELNERFEICFDEVKFLEQPLATEYSKGKNIVLDVLVSDDYLTLPILPPKLHDLPLNECNLKCLGCDSILAIPHPEYVVEDEAAEEIMEAAMGCCRCCCSTAATKCAHLRPSDTGKILIDDGIVLITEKVKVDAFLGCKQISFSIYLKAAIEYRLPGFSVSNVLPMNRIMNISVFGGTDLIISKSYL